jgi:DNA-binding transcriptional LysR family regulator
VVGRLSLAAFPTAARGLAPPTLAALGARYPLIEIALAELEPETAMPLVSRGDLDLAIVQDWSGAPLAVPDGLVKSALMDDLADVALPARHSLARRGVIDLAEVAHEPWITWDRRSICHDWLLATLRALGVEPRIAHTASEYQTQLALVAAGLGVGILPRLGRGALPGGIRAVPVRSGLRRHVYAVWRADAARRPVIRATVEALRAAARTVASTSATPRTARAAARERAPGAQRRSRPT